ncbi:MAG TPA: FimV/HubP family polar landmark protein [Burkholderiales bacterium]|nr:FimV/HubP family polar landmark protein [Burkholderiales bacterium]
MGKTSLRASIIAAALFLVAGAAEGAGLGKLTVLSHLAEPLRAEIDVVAPEKSELETLSVRLGSPEAYAQSNLPYPPSSLGLRMALDKRAGGDTYIKVTSAQPVPEPFVDLIVELNWQGGKIVRAYTALLDPPAFAAQPPAAQPSAEQPAAPTPGAAAPPPSPGAAAPTPSPPPQPQVETRMGSEMQLPPAETPPTEVAAAPAPVETAPGEPLPAPPPAEQLAQAPPAEAGMPAKPGAAPKEESYGPVKYGDTLSKIARQYKPDDVSLDQMLVLLWQNNKEAFSANNMNRLKTGKVLTIPDPSEAAGIPQKDARRQVHLQVVDFNAYRERLASAAGAAMPTPEQQAAGGKVTGPVQERGVPPAGEPKEVLKLSKGEAPGAGGGKATQERVRGLEEEVAARDKTIREANERIAKLEKTVKDMQGLLELKNKPMAELQKPAVTPPQPPPTPPAKAMPAPAPPAGPKPEATASAPPPPAPPIVATPAPGPMAASGTQPGVAATEPKPKPKPRAIVPPPPPPSMLDELLEEPTYLIGGGAVVALILGFFGYRFVRNRRAAADFGGPAEKKTSDVSAFAAASPDTGGAIAPARTSAAQPTIAEEVDPLAEAEIYLAYGRDGQAEEILKEALQNQPGRPEVHLKLLEIFAKRKDLAAFDPVARELQQVTGGQGELWVQAARLGYQIEPGNPRYAAGKPSAEAVAAAAATAAAAAAPTDKTLDFQIDSLEPSPEIGTLTDIDAGFGRRFATTAAASASAERLDLNIDDGAQPGTKTDIDLGKLSAAVNAATPVDLDLDSLGRPTGMGVASDISLATFSADQTAQMPVMDFNLDLPAGGEDKTQAQMAKVDAVDFDLKLDDTSTAAAGTSSVDFDIDRISLETGGARAEPVLDLGRSTPAVPDLDLSSINLDLGGSGPKDAEVGGKDDKWYDVQTKFDLAKAYQEMGDKEGAREILREVVAEGDAEQKAAAQKVLQTLS